MHELTRDLYKNLPRKLVSLKYSPSNLLVSRDLEFSRIRHEYIKAKYQGKTAYILACGPSLDMVWNDDLKRFLKDKLVISIKQAFNLVSEMTDFHLYNEVRMEKYNYKTETFRMGVSKYMSGYKPHIYYPINEYDYDKTLFVTQEYEGWDLENGIERPWGVGIMFELGLFLPVHLGCSKVVIIGFDMNFNGKFHFYDKGSGEDSQFYKVNVEEFEYAPKSIPHYLNWCQKKEIDVKAYSPLTALPFEQLKSLEEVRRYSDEV